MTSNAKTLVIAEAGVNHNGSTDLALRLVDAAAAAGADAVKFQAFKAAELATRSAKQAPYQKAASPKSSQWEMLAQLELPEEALRQICSHCSERGIQFLCTPFDLLSFRFLVNDLQLKTMKIGSGEITNAPLLCAAAQSRCEIILSTGMATLGEVEAALSVLAWGLVNETGAPSTAALREAYSSPEGQKALRESVCLLHCTSEYPAPFADVNLRAMKTLQAAFHLKVGLSDHTPGCSVGIAAVALGARIVEKHLTLDRSLSGPDHRASLEPEEFKELVRGIREVEQALGSPSKIPTHAETVNSNVVRKSLVAVMQISQGTVFTEQNLGVKRPGSGVSPFLYWSYLGKKAVRDYAPDEFID